MPLGGGMAFNMKKSLSLILCGIMIVSFILPVSLSASAAVLFQYGDLRVENNETLQLFYDGLLRTNLRTLYQGKSC